jgi:hypothetical protein
MLGRYFVSHSGANWEQWPFRLAHRLAAGPPRSLCDREAELWPHVDWDEQIVDANQNPARGVVRDDAGDAVRRILCVRTIGGGGEVYETVIPQRFDT